MKLAVAVQVVGSVLALILLGAATTERFHHPEEPSRQPAATQPAIPSTDEPHKDIFTGLPHERRAGLHASATMTNGLPGDTRNESRAAIDYTPMLAALVTAGGMWLASRLGHGRRLLGSA
jgi:hypothetical protein